MELEDYFKGGKAYVWRETFAIVKARRPLPDAFAIVQDKKEITAVIDQSKISDEDVIEAEKGWKLITFDMTLPFGLVGFLARVSKALADEGVSIFVISAYSTDHILVKEKDLSKAVKKLESLGFVVNEK